MAKDRFLRRNVHDHFLKKVILRLDYAGVTDLNKLVDVFDKKFPKAFKERNLVINREINVTLHKKDLEEIGKTLSLPVSIIEKSQVIRYAQLKKPVNCNVTLDICQYYLCMVIESNSNYDGLDNYTEYFKGAISVFKEKIPYFRPKRLGLRKFRQEQKETIEQAKRAFEDFMFPSKPYGLEYSPLRLEYIDCMLTNENIKFNIHSMLRKVKDEENHDRFESLLDLDAYYDREDILAGDINALLEKANQKEFEVYKNCLTEDYLSSICE